MLCFQFIKLKKYFVMDAEFVSYRFEDGYEGVVLKKNFKLGVRHVQILYMLLCSVVMGSIRGTNSVVVLAMTDEARRNDTYIQVHNWDRKIQGMMLSSFFFGYALMVVPAEILVKKIGPKLVMTFALITNGGLCVAMPTIVNNGGWIAVSNAQLLMGITHSVLVPTHKQLLSKWLPPYENKIFSPFIYSGIIFGIIIALPIAGVLSKARLGWELLFYSQAILGISMAVIWGLLTSSSPEKQEVVGDAEKEYIHDSLRYYSRKISAIPWRRIIRSSHFWALATAHAASNMLFTFYLVDMPAYLMVFRIPLKEALIQSLLPIAFLWIVYMTTAPCIQWLHSTDCISYVLSLTHARKLLNALCAFGIAVGLTLLSCLGLYSLKLTLVLFTAIMGLLGLQFSGFMEAHRDISQDFSGTVMVMSSAFAALFGAMEPLLSGLIIADNMSDQRRWRVLFLTLASFTIFCNVVYTMFGSSKDQHWGSSGKKKFGYHNDLELEELDSREYSLQHHNDTINNDEL